MNLTLAEGTDLPCNGEKLGWYGTNFVLHTKECPPPNTRCITIDFGSGHKAFSALYLKNSATSLECFTKISLPNGENGYQSIWCFSPLTDNWDFIPHKPAGFVFKLKYEEIPLDDWRWEEKTDEEMIEVISKMIREEPKNKKKSYKSLARKIFKYASGI